MAMILDSLLWLAIFFSIFCLCASIFGLAVIAGFLSTRWRRW